MAKKKKKLINIQKKKNANQMGSSGIFHFEIWLANQQRKDKMGSMVKFTSFFFIIIIIIIFLIMFYFIIHFNF